MNVAAVSETARQTKSAAPRVPDFFVAGHPRSGTTALYEVLRQHPEIFMPAVKEPIFLARDLQPQFRPFRTGRSPASLDEYLALFAGATPEQRAGEASPIHLM